MRMPVRCKAGVVAHHSNVAAASWGASTSSVQYEIAFRFQGGAMVDQWEGPAGGTRNGWHEIRAMQLAPDVNGSERAVLAMECDVSPCHGHPSPIAACHGATPARLPNQRPHHGLVTRTRI